MPIPSTAADYRWIEQSYPEWLEVYCVTLLKGLGPAHLLDGLGAEPAGSYVGVDALAEPAFRSYSGDRYFFGAARLQGWTLMVEHNGFLGVTSELMRPLSRGRMIVSHFRNVNAVTHFVWYRDGRTLLHFVPMLPSTRSGTRPEAFLPEMRRAGFDLTETEDPDFRRHRGASFAFAEWITGIRLTPEILSSAEFTGGIAARSRS